MPRWLKITIAVIVVVSIWKAPAAAGETGANLWHGLEGAAGGLGTFITSFTKNL